jgi:glycerophosphoryl diester phosphodiesterase
MSDTAKSLIITITVIAIGLTGAWIYVRDKGLKQPISPVRHAFFDQNPGENRFLIAYQGASLEAAANTLPAFEAAAQVDPRVILWADVQMTADRSLVVLYPKTLEELGGARTLVGFAHDEEINKLKVPVPRLEELLGNFPRHRFILNMREYRPGAESRLVEIVEAQKAGDRVLIQSEQDGLLRDLRDLRPLWLYGTSQAQVTQLLMLVSLRLEPIAPLKADVYITPAARDGASLVNEAVVAEIHRRERKIFAGPTTDADTINKLRTLGVDGLITPDPKNHLDFLGAP